MPKLCTALAAIAALPVVIGITCSPAMAEGGTILSQPGGRFVFGQISAARRDQYVLDTATGQLWRMTCLQVDTKKKKKESGNGVDINDCVSSGLMPVLYIAGENNNQYQYSFTAPIARPPAGQVK